MRATLLRCGRAVIVCSVIGVVPALAQRPRAGGVPAQVRQGFYLTALVGGVSTFQNLNIAGTEYLSGGPYVGGSLTWQPRKDQNLAVRAAGGWTRHILYTPRAGNGTTVDYFSLGPEIDYILLNSEHFTGGIFGGGGGVYIRESTTGASKLHPYARLGLDGTYLLSSRFRAVAQISGDIYELSNFPTTSPLGPYHRRQGDGLAAVGIMMKL